MAMQFLRAALAGPTGLPAEFIVALCEGKWAARTGTGGEVGVTDVPVQLRSHSEDSTLSLPRILQEIWVAFGALSDFADIDALLQPCSGQAE